MLAFPYELVNITIIRRCDIATHQLHFLHASTPIFYLSHLQVCDVTKAAREILLKAMGEGSVAPTAAEALAILDVTTVQKNLMMAFSSVAPPTFSSSIISTSEVTLEGLSMNTSSMDTTQKADNIVLEYVCQMTAHLVVYDTLPTAPLNGVSEDAWKYALATTETGQWKGMPFLLPVFLIPLALFFSSVPNPASCHFSRLCGTLHGSLQGTERSCNVLCK